MYKYGWTDRQTDMNFFWLLSTINRAVIETTLPAAAQLLRPPTACAGALSGEKSDDDGGGARMRKNKPKAKRWSKSQRRRQLGNDTHIADTSSACSTSEPEGVRDVSNRG